MAFFVICRNKPDSAARRSAIIDDHWAYIDRFSDRILVRGPLLDDDGTAVTGSIHIVELEEWEAVRAFTYDDPFWHGDIFETVEIVRFMPGLDRRQGDFVARAGAQQFFIRGDAAVGGVAGRKAIIDAHTAYCEKFDKNFISRGAQRNADGGTWAGSLFFVEFSDRAACDDYLSGEPFVKAGLYEKLTVERWMMGGPQNLSARGGPKF